jgi:hypothetical protein
VIGTVLDAATRSAVLDTFVAAVDTGFFAIGSRHSSRARS